MKYHGIDTIHHETFSGILLKWKQVGGQVRLKPGTKARKQVIFAVPESLEVNSISYSSRIDLTRTVKT